MKLEEITAELRPRTQWESIDLGVALTRRHFKPLILIWLLTVVPFWALCILLLRNHPGWCLLLIVYLRPVYDRPILFYLSRALFNAPPRIGEILRRLPKILAPGLLYSLTIARVSTVRSLLLPLHVLEGVRGQTYRDRRSAIIRGGGGAATWLTVICGFLELILVMGFIFLIIALIPPNLAPDWDETFSRFFSPYGLQAGLPNKLAWFAIGIFLIAMTFVEIFYVGCGFALYLNSRSHVEGWDIEITFRRLATKLRAASTKTTVGAIALATILAGLQPAPGQDAPQRDEVKAELREIMAHEDFIIHEGVRRVSRGSDRSSESPDLSFMNALGEVIFWLTIAVGIGALAWVVYLNRHLFSGASRQARPEPPAPRTRTVMGLDVAPDTLPSDIPAAALEAWRKGDPHLATSLLYRGAICWLVEAADLPLADSDTEGDCLLQSSTLGDAAREEYFSRLTAEWISTAYNQMPPSESSIRQLCDNWPFELGGARQ
ncbi:MAG: hypothetical protein ACR2RV_23510 [Verrucomicrobiales bacterium]